MMTRVREVVRVDASGASLGALVELLMLRRTADRRIAVADSTPRGRLLRRLLASSRLFVSEGSCGAIHRPAGGNAAADAASNDFAKTFQTQLVAAGVQAHTNSACSIGSSAFTNPACCSEVMASTSTRAMQWMGWARSRSWTVKLGWWWQTAEEVFGPAMLSRHCR